MIAETSREIKSRVDLNAARSYWDYEPRERALMSRDDVARFVDYELMTKGVLRVTEPKLDRVPEVEPETIDVFETRIAGAEILFRRQEEAQAFLSLHPAGTGFDYAIGYDAKLRHIEDEPDLAIVPRKIMEKSEFLRVKALLIERKRILDANERASANYQKARKAEDEALDSLWADWSEQRDMEFAAQEIQATFTKYVDLAGGDRRIAAKFLLKAFSRNRVEESFAWLGLTFDDPDVPDAAPDEEPVSAEGAL